MSRRRSGAGGPGRRLVLATAVVMVTVVGMPVALAGYTSIYAPTQAIAPRQLLTPSLSCTAPLALSVKLTWYDADATTASPYTSGAFAISSYVIERQVGAGGNWDPFATPARLTSTVNDNPNLGGLAIGVQISYRIRSIRSTNWTSADDAVTATIILGALGVHLISC